MNETTPDQLDELMDDVVEGEVVPQQEEVAVSEKPKKSKKLSKKASKPKTAKSTKITVDVENGTVEVEQKPAKKAAKKGKSAAKSPAKKADKKPIKAAKGKVAKKVAAKVKAPKAKKERVKPIGPGTKRFKFKAERVKGKCDVEGCKKPATTPSSFRCAGHKKEIRKVQLAENNVIWRERLARGEAGHHLSYRGKATQFAASNPDKALKIAKEKGILPPEKLQSAIERAQKQQAMLEAKRAKAEKKTAKVSEKKKKAA